MGQGGLLTVHRLPQPFRLEKVIEESSRVKTFVMKGCLEAEPGQFVMLWLPGVDEKPFSLVDCAPITLTVARVGPFTTQLHRRRPGDMVWLRGPFGRGFTIEGKRLLLIGGGYGVAPLLFLARRAREKGCRVDVVIGASTAAEIILAQRFRELGCGVHIATEDGTAGVRAQAPELSERLLPHLKPDALYACGPEGMLETVRNLAERKGLPVQLSYERYMRCAIGVCGSCQRSGWLVCRDGPVLSIQ